MERSRLPALKTTSSFSLMSGSAIRMRFSLNENGGIEPMAQPSIDAAWALVEQNRADSTFGFGVVFSDRALEFLRGDDPATYDLITPEMEAWSDITVVHRGTAVVIDGIGFAAIGRLK